MQTIVIAGQKGGSGKTTVTAHLAVAAERAGHGPAVLVDTDPQETLSTWWRARESDTPKLAQVSVRDLPAQLAALAQMRFAYCFIDTAPALSDQNRQVIGFADLVVIPARPSPADLWAIGRTLEIINNASTPFVFALTQAKSTARITMQSMDALSEHGHVLASVIHDRVDYAAAMTDGRTAIELRPRGPAALESVELWRLAKERLSELANRSERATGRLGE